MKYFLKICSALLLAMTMFSSPVRAEIVSLPSETAACGQWVMAINLRDGSSKEDFVKFFATISKAPALKMEALITLGGQSPVFVVKDQSQNEEEQRRNLPAIRDAIETIREIPGAHIACDFPMGPGGRATGSN